MQRLTNKLYLIFVSIKISVSTFNVDRHDRLWWCAIPMIIPTSLYKSVGCFIVSICYEHFNILHVRTKLT